jgi:hypothetical protein
MLIPFHWPQEVVYTALDTLNLFAEYNNSTELDPVRSANSETLLTKQVLANICRYIDQQLQQESIVVYTINQGIANKNQQVL